MAHGQPAIPRPARGGLGFEVLGVWVLRVLRFWALRGFGVFILGYEIFKPILVPYAFRAIEDMCAHGEPAIPGPARGEVGVYTA